MARKTLVNITWLFFGIAVLAIAYILFGGLAPSQKAIAQKEHIIDLSIVSVGQPVKVETKRGPIFLLQPSSEQFDNLRKLDDHVWDVNYTSYNEDLNLFVVHGISTRFGCELEHFPIGESPIFKLYKKAHGLVDTLIHAMTQAMTMQEGQ